MSDFSAKTAFGSASAICAALAKASVNNSSALQTRFTKPQASARCASMKLPVRLISRARLIPMSRDSFCDRPQPGRMPTLACVSAKRACSLANRKSQASANSKPPVTAAPLTAPIIGCGHCSMATTIGDWGPNPSPLDNNSGSSVSALRSTPAQNTRPAPVSTIALTDSDAASPPKVAIIASDNSRLSALLASGRFRVTRATPASSWTSITDTGNPY